MSGVAELHSAFVWDCDQCGRENFSRAIECHIEPECLEQVTSFLAVQLDRQENEADFLVQKVVAYPKYVNCQFCHQNFLTHIPNQSDDHEF